MEATYAQFVFDRIEELGEDNLAVRTFRARERTTQLLDAVIRTVLESLGIDYSKDDGSGSTIRPQMMDRDIAIAELDTAQMLVVCQMAKKDPSEEILGLYVYQKDDPKFFIQDPKVDSEGKVIIKVYSFDKNMQFQQGDFRIPV